MLSRRTVLCRTPLLDRFALLRGLALLRRRARLRCRTVLCPITNRIPVDSLPPDLIAPAQALAERSARRTGGTGSGQSPERLASAALLQSLASFR